MKSPGTCGDGKVFDATSSLATILVKLCVLLLICVLVLPLFIKDPDSFRGSFRQFISSHASFDFSGVLGSHDRTVVPSRDSDGPLSRLIDDIRQAVNVATGGSNVSFSAVDRQNWEEHFRCKSRGQLEQFYQKRKGVRYIPVSQRWQKVLDEYAVLHRVCMSRVGDLKDYFSSKNESTGCKFLVADARFGLGNKIYHVSSLLVYAVLTQRVILIPRSKVVPAVVCEPFPGSSWSIADEVHQLIKSQQNSEAQLFAGIDESVLRERPLGIYAAEGGGTWGPNQRFWCDREQTYFRNITWLTYDGCLYHLPRLFSIPTFRPIMEDIFPDRVALTHVLRTAMLPADPVWERVLHVQNVYMGNAGKQVGLQIRLLHGEKQYSRDNVTIGEHISKCLRNHNFIPQFCAKNASCSSNSSQLASVIPPSNSATPAVFTTKVFIASLFGGFRQYLEHIYLQHDETSAGESVEFIQLTHNRRQGSGLEEDTEALVEILTLSFSDVLLITPYSTFGGLAQGYGTQLPFFIEYNMTAPDVCQRAVSKEPCCLGSAPVYECRYDPTGFSEVVKSVPYLERCLWIDVGATYGMLLMNKEDDALS